MFTGNHMDDYAGQKTAYYVIEPKQFNNIVYKGNQSIFGLTYETKLCNQSMADRSDLFKVQ